jgi:cytoskeletal protein CcmA (bactofilin family)
VKLNLHHKLKSGALQFAVFISVLIALLLGGLLLYAYTFGYFKEQSKATIENIQLTDTAINYLLQQSEISSDTISLDLLENNNQTIQVHVSPWGIFQKVFVKAQHRKKIFIKTAFIGTLSDVEESPTLYLQETYNPLTLVGNTKIKGNAFLPSQGVRSGYIAGESYYGSQLIYGKVEKSGVNLPKLNKNNHEQLLFYISSIKPTNQADFISLESNKKIVNSFKQKTKNVYSTQQIILENIEISGNIIIKSDTLIQVKKTAKLKEAILIAPIIEIEEGTSGAFQAIATNKISVDKNCKLYYPSALVLYQDNQNQNSISINTTDNQVFINSNTQINGSVCYFQTKTFTSDFNTQIVLEEDSRIKGQVYCEGSFALKGTVSGSVYTKQFIANQAGSIFVNHIYNGTIENETISKLFGGILFENQPKTVLKWLY